MLIMNRLPFLLAFLLLFFLNLVDAQRLENGFEDMAFKRFTSSDGLSQRSVMSILQDVDGYLWFGTRDGLNKYDGNKFTIYRHNLSDPNSLSNNNIHVIYEDSKGGIWVGTQNGLNKYHPETDQFEHFKQIEGFQNLSSNVIWDLIELEGYLYISTNEGMNRLDLRNNEIRIYRQENKIYKWQRNQKLLGYKRREFVDLQYRVY